MMTAMTLLIPPLGATPDFHDGLPDGILFVSIARQDDSWHPVLGIRDNGCRPASIIY
jgi:hypothetical protein